MEVMRRPHSWGIFLVCLAVQRAAGLRSRYPLAASSSLLLQIEACLCLLAGAKAAARLVLKGLETIAPLVRSVEETPEPIPTEVQGSIPSWIHGNLLRNGPGKFEFGNRQ